MKTNTTNTTATINARTLALPCPYYTYGKENYRYMLALPCPSYAYDKGSYKYLLVRFGELASDTTITDARNPHAAEYSALLERLSATIALSTLNKCISVGGVAETGARTRGDGSHAKQLEAYRRELVQARSDLRMIKRYNNAPPYKTIITQDGTEKRICTDTDLQRAYDSACARDLGSGIDFLQVAAAALLEEREHALKKYSYFDLERRETRRVLRAHVSPWLETEKDFSARAYTDKETTPITQVYKAVRKYITDERHNSAESIKYGYEETTVTDAETGVTETAYKRTSIYSDLQGVPCNTLASAASAPEQVNAATLGAPTVTGDATELEYLQQIIRDMRLSDQQKAILNKRLSGKNISQIITDYAKDHTTKSRRAAAASISKQSERMREKALKLLPEWERKYFSGDAAGVISDILETAKKPYKAPRLSTVTDDYNAWTDAETVEELAPLFLAILETILSM